jgi:uncharacterized sulfatase
MERQEFLKSMGAVTLGGVLADLGLFDRVAHAASIGDDAPPPNILFLLVDEMRLPSVFPHGIRTREQFLRTFMPNTYELWQHGVKFENHFTAGTACTPARAVLATGLYPHQQWLLATRTAAAPSLQHAFPTYGKLLRSLGYETPYIGKWHLSNPPTPPSTTGYLERYGFDGMTNPDPTGTNGQGAADDPNIADQAVAWLGTRSGVDTPFCLTVSFVNPHDRQYFWGGSEGTSYEELFAGKSVQAFVTGYVSVPGEDAPQPLGYPALPPNWESAQGLMEHHKPSTHSLFRTFQQAVWGGATDNPRNSDFAVEPSPIYPNKIGLGIAPFSYWQRGLDMYTYTMQLVDNEIGRVVAAVPRDKLHNTVFVMASDHGEYSGAHGFLAGKIGTLYDEAWHVPLIVADPSGRFTAHTDVRRTQLTSSVDFAPMLATLGNKGSRSWMTGDLARIYGKRLDLVTLLRDPNAAGRDHVLFATDELIPDTMNYLRAPIHVLGVRTADAKLGTYSHWVPGTTQPILATMELEFYDYATPEGRAETLSTPDDPRAKALLQALLQRYVPLQMEAPLPPSLRPAQERAKLAYLGFEALANLYSVTQLIDERKISTLFGFGQTV